MNKYDLIVIAILAICISLALFFTFRKKKSGSCCGGSGCGNCAGCPLSQSCEKQKK